MEVSELDNLVSIYGEARKKYEAKKVELIPLKEDLDKAEAAVYDALVLSEKSKYHVDGVGTVSLDDVRYSVRVPKNLSDIRAFKEWLAENYGPDVADAKLTINSASLNKIYNDKMKEAVDSGDAVLKIPGIGEATEYQKMKFKKA